MKLIALFIVLGLLSVGCGGGDDSSSAPTIENLSGTWKGTATDDISSEFVNISMELTQSENSISGKIFCTDGSVVCSHPKGNVIGSRDESKILMGIVWDDGHTCIAFDGNLDANTLNGIYACSEPAGDSSGTWNMTR